AVLSIAEFFAKERSYREAIRDLAILSCERILEGNDGLLFGQLELPPRKEDGNRSGDGCEELDHLIPRHESLSPPVVGLAVRRRHIVLSCLTKISLLASMKPSKASKSYDFNSGIRCRFLKPASRVVIQVSNGGGIL